MFLLNGLAGGERERPHGAAMEGAEESQIQFPPGVPAGQFEGCFDGFGAGVAEIDLACAGTRRDAGELLRQHDLGRVIEIRAGHVQESLGLFLDGPHHERMAMSRGADRDSGSEIEKDVAVRITNPEPFGRFGHQTGSSGYRKGIRIRGQWQ